MNITLTAPWTYRTPMVTIDYTAGDHDVADEIAAAHAKEMTDGNQGTAKAGSARGGRKA